MKITALLATTLLSTVAFSQATELHYDLASNGHSYSLVAQGFAPDREVTVGKGVNKWRFKYNLGPEAGRDNTDNINVLGMGIWGSLLLDRPTNLHLGVNLAGIMNQGGPTIGVGTFYLGFSKRF